MPTSTQPATMTVWRQSTYGTAEAVSPETVHVPRPRRGEVLLRVEAVSLNSGDVRLMRGRPGLIRLFFGLRRPRIRGRGMDVAGTVVALGDDVDGLAIGDRVVGAGEETLADFAVVRASRLVPLPEGVDAEHAAALPVAGNTAVAALDACRVGAGSRVLVVGAGGGVGTLTVQIAADRGAEVWATCGARAEGILRGLGAARTFDYRRTSLADLPAGSFDAIIDIAGEPPLRTLRDLLRPGGTVALVGGGGDGILGPIPRMLESLVVRARFRPIMATSKPTVTAELLSLLAAGRLTPTIERTWPLSQARAALAWVDAGRTVGKVVVRAD